MEQNKININEISPTPWEWAEFTSHSPTEEAQGTTIMDRSGYYISHQFNIRPIQQRQAIAASMVSAVNNTYGIGVNPEAIPDLLNALNSIAKHFFHEGNNSHKSLGLQSIYKSAIEKAKL